LQVGRFVSVIRASFLVALFALVLAGAAPGSRREAGPAARVGAIYFDGWACPLSNFHFKGLISGQFAAREPLNGWRDNSVESMRTQLTWAHQDGIGFFLFDWYRENVDPCLNVALQNYKSLGDHHGVGFALLLVNDNVDAISPQEWPAFAERWVTEDFLNPDYERVDGKPLFVILDTTGFRQQMGGTAGVNAALAALREAAQRHGLPGVFVVGGRYTAYGNIECFPQCDATDGGPNGLRLEHYDALSEYNSAGTPVPRGGSRPYRELTSAVEDEWRRFAQLSPFPWIPSVTDGWDPRPWDERPFGYLFWFTRTPAEVAAFVQDAIAWLRDDPSMRVGAASAPPLVLIEAWNELGEGSFLIPTEQDRYGYGRALASILGVPWTAVHARRITMTLNGIAATGTLTVLDDWTPCDVSVVKIERKLRGKWVLVRATTTRPGGAFAVTLRRGRIYRARVSHAGRYGQTCGPALSAPVAAG
jgi:hypothetical protein